MEVEEGGLLLDGDKVKLALKKKNAMLEPFSLCLVVIPHDCIMICKELGKGSKTPVTEKFR